MTKFKLNKTHKITAFALALVLCFSAFLWIVPQVQAQELDISNTSVTDFTAPGARTTITNGNLTGGSIGVYVVSATGGRYKADNVKWTHNNGDWELDGDSKVLFENNSEKQQIAAYYPYTETANGKVTITLPEAYDANYDQYDYLYGEYASLSSNPATIKMNHLMAKVSVTVASIGNEVAGDDAVESIALADVPRTAEWTLPSAVLSNFGNGERIGLYDNDGTYEGYALPTEAQTLTLRITMKSGRIFTATVSLDDLTTADETESLEGGVHYKIGVKVGKDRVEISTINVTPWLEKKIDGGVAVECTHETIAEDGTCNTCGKVIRAIVSSEAELNAAMADGAYIVLSDNAEIETISIPANMAVTIDLNGLSISKITIADGANVTLMSGVTERWSNVDEIEIGAAAITMEMPTRPYSKIILNSKDAKLDISEGGFNSLEVCVQADGCSTSQFTIPEQTNFHSDKIMFDVITSEQLTMGTSYYVGYTWIPDYPF